ncbi:NADH-quinone oxidoreductase subunit C [Usitatibacter palustris]|uniref:NADH-quinone oxidoreductase subunit C n=1 Tax=Usitatibacter palustris TaxID=2732487 RepID=A0A6M4HBT7_9PROT|nr:NADH-quinone oxidoreductase subunit C [Usitatibacter palustris]QJR16083.1 NAD(P)H-quinone oxidoreductase subunit J, chloroplastic [Usitatibacter palustris]
MAEDLATLQASLGTALGARLKGQVVYRGQLTIEVAPADLVAAATILRDDPALAFTILIDLIGMDYEGFGEGSYEGSRFAIVYNLLSISQNQRVRVKVFADSADFPGVDTLVGVWPSANWFEREAFDLYGIVFKGHPDLRRILTDYGFVGHPFRKDFPISGYVEMRYDDKQKRVIYQPVSIEPREIVPRVIREDAYGDSGKK